MCAEAYVPESQYPAFIEQDEIEYEKPAENNIIVLVSFENGVPTYLPANIHTHFEWKKNKYILTVLDTNYTDAIPRIIDKRSVGVIPDDRFRHFMQTDGATRLNTRVVYQSSEPIAAHEQMHMIK